MCWEQGQADSRLSAPSLGEPGPGRQTAGPQLLGRPLRPPQWGCAPGASGGGGGHTQVEQFSGGGFRQRSCSRRLPETQAQPP